MKPKTYYLQRRLSNLAVRSALEDIAFNNASPLLVGLGMLEARLSRQRMIERVNEERLRQ